MLYVQHWDTTRPLWLDEQMIAINLRERSLTQLTGPLWLEQSAPYGWLVLQRLTLLVFGDAESGLRLVPLVFGMLTVVAAVWMASRWLTQAGGPVLVVLLGLGQWLAFNAFEVKHYSADAFWALWLPALALWAVETRRAWVWWCAAAVGLWTANGAVFVAPSCALALLGMTWHRHGTRAMVWTMAGGLIWLASFALHYQLVLQHTLGSRFLAEYWAFALPPDGSGVWDTLTWLVARGPDLTMDPGGTAFIVLFWLTACVGWALRWRALGLVMAMIPVTAGVLAAVGLVPLFGRLTLWSVPALYVGIAIVADYASRWPLPRRAMALPHLALAVAAAVLLYDMVPRGYAELNHPPYTNHSLNDRYGVEALLLGHQPDDVIITTELALPAIWWYGKASLGDEHQGAQLPDGTPILQARFHPPGPDCQRGQSSLEPLAGRRLAHVYLGFRFDDVPNGFDQLLLDELSRVGTVRNMRRVPDVGRVITLGLGEPAMLVPPLEPQVHATSVHLDGCISLRPAQRW